MRSLLLGIDGGTPSTTVVVVNASNGKVLGAGSQGYDLHKNRDFSRDRCSTARIMKNIEKGFIFEALKNR